MIARRRLLQFACRETRVMAVSIALALAFSAIAAEPVHGNRDTPNR